MKNNLAVVYVRVSTDEQADQGLSLEVQEERCVAQVKKDGFRLHKVIRDEGKSAKSLIGRNGMKEIVELATAGKIAAVYMVSSDRFARNLGDHIYLRDLLHKHDVELKFLNQPNMDNSAMGTTIDNVMASFNQMHSLVTSEKVRETIGEKAKAGFYPGVAPIGYKNIDNPKPIGRLDKKIIVPDEIMAPLITEMFNLYATGNYNGFDLNELMYSKGLRTRKGTKLSISRFYEVIRHRIYMGEINWGEIHVENANFEPLIDRHTFEKVQSVWEGQTYHAPRHRKYNWLLSGFVYCPLHERPFTAEFHGKKPSYYHCPNSSGCSKYIQTETLEKMIAEKFKDIEFTPSFINSVIQKVKEAYYKRREGYAANRQRCINQRKALEDKKRTAEEKLFAGVLADTDYTRIKTEITTELRNLDDRLYELEQKQDIRVDAAQEILKFARSIFDAYKDASPNLKRHYLGFFWDKFEVKDGVIINSVQSLLFRELLRLQAVSCQTRKLNNHDESKQNSPVIIKHQMSRWPELNRRPTPSCAPQLHSQDAHGTLTQFI